MRQIIFPFCTLTEEKQSMEGVENETHYWFLWVVTLTDMRPKVWQSVEKRRPFFDNNEANAHES